MTDFKGHRDRQKRVRNVIRRAHNGEKLNKTTVAWIRSLEPYEVALARHGVAGDDLNDMIAQGSETLLYSDDSSRLEKEEILKEAGYWMTCELKGEVGAEATTEFIEELLGLISLFEC